MKPQKLTTEDTEKENFRFLKSSVNSVVGFSPKEYPWIRRVGLLINFNVEMLNDGIKRRIL